MNDVWDRMVKWELVLPPSRPSTHQLNLLDGLARHLPRNGKCAVLGSTPEYRDRLYEMGFQSIAVLDRNPKFYQQMSSVRIYDNTETLMLGDWRDTLAQAKGSFVLLVSDLTSGNIPYEDRAEFYELIENSLAPGGIYFDKILTHRGSHIPIADLLEKYERVAFNLATINEFSSEVLFCSSFLDRAEVVDSSEFYSILDQSDSVRIRAFSKAAAQYVTPRGGIWYYGRDWTELEKSYCRRLRLLHSEPELAPSPYVGRVWYYCFQKDYKAD